MTTLELRGGLLHSVHWAFLVELWRAEALQLSEREETYDARRLWQTEASKTLSERRPTTLLTLDILPAELWRPGGNTHSFLVLQRAEALQLSERKEADDTRQKFELLGRRPLHDDSLDREEAYYTPHTGHLVRRLT